MFQGVFTAIITPFTETDQIDWPALEKLVEEQISSGVAGIVPMGTTGESPTVSTQEHDQIVSKICQQVQGRCKVIAGTGSNCTRSAIRTSLEAEKAGVDGCLVVNPYYNKPTQEGLFQHFKAIADAVSTPIILYNIQGRTGVNLETTTILRLLESSPNITAVKEASGNMAQIRDVIDSVPSYFSVLSGDDGLTLELIKAGGHGVISVASNLLPQQMVDLVQAALEGQIEQAAEIDRWLQPFFEAEMIETNPIPIKAALAMVGKIKEYYRLPLCPMGAENREKLYRTLKALELLTV